MRRRFAPLLSFVLCCIVLAATSFAEVREWSDATGAFKRKGELVAFDGKVARLNLDLGTVNLPIEKLSAADQNYLKTNFPDGKSPELLMKTPGKGGAPGGSAGGKGQLKVELAGVAVVKPVDNLPAEVAPLPPGTHVWLLVSDAETPVAGVDQQKSKIATFADNKGTDLAEGATAGESFEFTALPDGKSGLVHLHREQVPEAKAVRATLKGVLHLQAGDAGNTVAAPLNFEITLGF